MRSAEARSRRMWRLVEEGALAVGAHHLVDAFAEQEPVIEDRDDGVALAGEAPVDVDHGGHCRRS